MNTNIERAAYWFLYNISWSLANFLLALGVHYILHTPIQKCLNLYVGIFFLFSALINAQMELKK